MHPPRRLLYIDDDEGLCRIVKKDFERGSYLVDMALSGAEGIGKARQTRYDAVVLDHHMPGQDGLQTLEQIFALGDPPPVIYVTGESEGRVAVAALKAGATEYVIKEASADFLPLLRAAVAGAIEQRELKHAREKAEAELRASRDRFESLAAEREVLIHEISHRIANSLQLVNAFLRLQANAATNGDAKAALSNAMARVGAIGHVHRQLYSANDVRSVDLARYLENLMGGLRQAVGETAASAELVVKAEPVSTTTDRAVSIGTLVTELVLNALKYAYPEGRPGEIRVLCRRTPGDVLELTVEDDGVGLQPGAPAKGGGLGERIIGMMAQKLHATIERDDAHRGVRTRIMVPLANGASPA
ncbi:MAG TPA: histidine kinase dimerization/phosphoacceptor domain -containing protein [Dongiaceae bacterium]|jgi:two-component sensor histidine kinase|nr:histidine kinase dimerization/phosphoacceptor domain -containing protein [Dongiaceae bacterium]